MSCLVASDRTSRCYGDDIARACVREDALRTDRGVAIYCDHARS